MRTVLKIAGPRQNGPRHQTQKNKTSLAQINQENPLKKNQAKTLLQKIKESEKKQPKIAGASQRNVNWRWKRAPSF